MRPIAREMRGPPKRPPVPGGMAQQVYQMARPSALEFSAQPSVRRWRATCRPLRMLRSQRTLALIRQRLSALASGLGKSMARGTRLGAAGVSLSKPVRQRKWMLTRDVTYRDQAANLRGVLADAETAPGRRPGVLVIHEDWVSMGTPRSGRAGSPASSYVALPPATTRGRTAARGRRCNFSLKS